MDAENHPDPFQEAAHHAVQRAVQIGSVAATCAQMYLYLKNAHARAVAERDERIRRALNAQIRADRDAARARWAPALDREWLGQAGLLQTARAWGAAMPYADRAVPWYEPAAATAMRRCEERLRGLHPYAMAYYDRLRSDGMAPADAMREAAPLFTRPPRVHDAPFTPRPVLDRGIAPEPARPPSAGGAGPRTSTTAAGVAYATGGPRPWERDFPMPIHDVMAATATQGATAPSQVPARVRAVTPVRGPRL
jgi:hypothetical protein